MNWLKSIKVNKILQKIRNFTGKMYKKHFIIVQLILTIVARNVLLSVKCEVFAEQKLFKCYRLLISVILEHFQSAANQDWTDFMALSIDWFQECRARNSLA